MRWPTLRFEELYAEPSKNGLTRPARVRGSGCKMINMGELFANDRIGDISMELVPINDRELATMLVKKGDLLFARQSLVLAGAGKCSIVQKAIEPTTFESHIIRVRLKRNAADPRFFFYYFRSPYCGIRSIVIQGVQAGIRSNDLKGLLVHVPPIEEQHRIASILSAYDDLIENNRRRIQLLEESARLLYKEWFVHLRFPGHEDVSIIDGVPQGWERRTIADVCTTFDDGDWIESKDQSGEDFRLLQVSNIGNNKFIETGNFRYITSETFRNLRCNEVIPGDILISRMPKPIGRAWLVNEQPWRMITAVDVTIARPDPDIVDPFYCMHHLNSPAHIARCELRATGATRPRVTRKNIGALPILKPPMSLQRTFSEVASAANDQRNILTRQNNSLTQARDLLLPRLMNGELAA